MEEMEMFHIEYGQSHGVHRRKKHKSTKTQDIQISMLYHPEKSHSNYAVLPYTLHVIQSVMETL